MPGTDSKASTQHDAATVLGRRPTESRVRPQPPPQDFWFSLGMMIGYYTLSYAFVRVSDSLSLSRIPLIWISNGLHVGALASANLKLRIFVPFGFFVAVFLGLLPVYETYALSAEIAILHTLESILISGVLFSVLNEHYHGGTRSLLAFLGASAIVSIATALCRSLIIVANTSTSFNLGTCLLLDWSSTFPGLIIVAPIISSFSHKQITKLQRSAKRMQQIVPVGTVIMSLLISFVLSFAIGNRSAILTFYIHFGLAFIGGYFGGEIGQSFTCLAGLLSNLGFNFIWKDDTNGLITTDFSSGHLPILHLYSILQITGLLTGNLSRKTRNAYDHVAKAIEVNIKKVNMDLEITRKALEQGRDREEVKSRYIAFLCEQFHRPLLSIMQNCESTKADQEAIREVIEPVFASTGYLLSLVDDVLSFIQLERGLLRLQPTSLNLMGLLNSALTCANEVFNSQGIFFEHQVVNAPEFIVTDAIRFQQSILNILLTVAENVNPGTQLTLRTSTRFITDTIRSVMSAKDNKSSLLEISIVFPVENMSDSELQALFHPYKMKSDKEGDQGSGLSMAISQRIIELMGGNILAERLKSDEVSISVVLPTSLSPKGVVASKQVSSVDRDSDSDKSSASKSPSLFSVKPTAAAASTTIPIIATSARPSVTAQPSTGSRLQGHSTVQQTVVGPTWSPSSALNSSFTQSSFGSLPKNTRISEHLCGSVLVADDSSIFRQILKKMLLGFSDKFDVYEAMNGEEVVILAQKIGFSIIMMDLEMPKMNGDECATKLRAGGITCPIIAISGQTISRETAVTLQLSGFTQIQSKPVSKEIMKSILKQHNKGRQKFPLMTKGKDRPPSVTNRDILQQHGETVNSGSSIEYHGELADAVQDFSDTISGGGTLSRIKPIGANMASEYSTSTTFDLRSQISSSSVGVHHASTAVQDVSMARASEVDHTTGDNLRLNALVVDDSLINRSILVRVLEKFGQFSEIIEVSTGHDAVRLCASKKFAIIFMDLEMPGMSGDEAAARIRSIGVTTPIVAVTGNVTRGDDINPLKQAGISEIVKKPVERQRVIDLCKSFIKFPIAVQQNQEKTGGARDSAVISVSKR